MNIADIFQYEFIQNSLLVGILIGVILPLAGILVFMRRMSFISDSIGHVNMSGIAFVLLVATILPGAEKYTFVIALVYTVLGAVLIEYLRTKFVNYREVSIMIVYSFSVALTMIFLNLSTGYSSSLFAILFGNINAITRSDLLFIFILSILSIVIFIKYFKEFILLGLEENYIKMYGINTVYIRYLFITVVTVVIAISITAVGVLLVSSLMIIPLITSINFAQNLKQTVIYSIIITEFSVLFGIVAGIYLDVSTSAVIVVITIILYIISLIIKKMR